MHWFRNLKTAQKLLTAFGLCLTLATIMGVVSVMRMFSINDAADQIAKGAMSRMYLVSVMTGDMRQYRVLEFAQLLETRADAMAKIGEKMRERTERIDRCMADYDRLANLPEDQRAFGEVKAAWGQYLSKADEQNRLALASDFKNGNNLLNERMDAYQSVTDLVGVLRDGNKERSDKLAAEAHSVYKSARATVIGLLSITILLGLAGAIYITRLIVSSLGEMAQVADALAAGDTSSEVTYVSRDEVGSLADSFRSMTAYMREAATAASTIAQGNLAVSVTPKSDRDTLGNALAEMVQSLSKLIANVRVSSDSISVASEQVASGNHDLSQRTEEQAASLEETAASMEEMTSTVKQNADNSRQADQLATQARKVAEEGGNVVSQAVASMAEVRDGSRRVADIVTVIDEIAFQTNLLALNASVEAARVGEQGKGFAVVASEVRSLAGRSATAAKEIKALVQETVSRVEQGSDLVNASGTRLEEIVQSIKKVSDVVSEISAASVEQSSGIEQVNKAVMQMDQVTQQNAALVEESSAAASSMKEQARDLQTLVSRFTLDNRYAVEAQSRSVERPALREGTTGRAIRPAAPRRPAPRPVLVGGDDGFEEF